MNIKEKPKLLVQVCADLLRHEAYKKYAYPDPLSLIGKKYRNYKWGDKPAREILSLIGQPPEKGEPWTVGVGYTHGVNPDSTMTKEQAMHKLEDHVLECVADLNRVFPEWKDASFVTQTVLLNMIYNMGAKGLSAFKNTLKFLRVKDYDAAASNLKKSLWYSQVGNRAKELVERIRTQTIAEQHLA